MTSSNRRKRRSLTVIESFHGTERDDAEFWARRPHALQAFGRILARRANEKRRQATEQHDTPGTNDRD